MGYLITLHIKQIASKICVSSENLAEQILLACQVMSNLHLWIFKKVYIIQNCFKYQSRLNKKSLFGHCLDTSNLSGEQGKKH